MTNFRILVFILALSVSLGASAQLFVKPSGPASAQVPSYVYVNDTFIYVEQDVELEINPDITEESSIILRNEAQLLQGNGDGSITSQQNKGTGDLSLYQEGTVNRFDYNFWGSPVGLAFQSAGTAALDGNGVFAFKDTALEGFQSAVFFTPTTLTQANPALLNPTFDGSSGPNMLSIAHYWLWSFRSGADYADWFHLDNLNTLEAGYGFTMKGVDGLDTTIVQADGVMNNDGLSTNGTGQRIDFRGRPNNGTIMVEVGPDNALTLVGNPYPSALDLNYFLLQNSGSGDFTATDINGNTITVTRSNFTTGTALFWDSNPNVMSHNIADYQGGYGAYSPMMNLNDPGMNVNATFYMYTDEGVQIPDSNTTTPQDDVGTFARRFSPIGQGFMIQGTDGGMAQFTNNQRVFIKEGNNSDFRSSENTIPVPVIGVATYYPDANLSYDYPRLKIGIGINDTYSRELGIALHSDATSGYDVAGDARMGGLGTDVSFSIENEKGYVINTAPQIESQLLPITLDAETTAEYRFKVHLAENFNYEGVYLLDNETETYHDILNESVLIQLEAGEHSDRFAITFTAEMQTNDDDDDDTLNVNEVVLETGILESISVFQNNPSGQLEIHNPLNVSLETMSLFDMAGKLIISENELGIQSIYNFPTSNLSSGIYIAQFVTSEGLTKARKISVTN